MDNSPPDQFGPPAATGPNAPVPQKSTGATGVSFSSEHGAFMVPSHVTRYMKIYPIPEHELELLRSWGSDKTFWSSVGSGILALLAGCVWDWSQLPNGAQTTATSKLIFWVLVAACVFSYARAGWRALKVNQALKKIETRTEVA